MTTRVKHRSNSLALTTLVLCVTSLIGCHGTLNQRTSEKFDRSTGMTLLTADAPMAFARTEGQYSRSARDYVYLAPVETNRQGTRDYYLWVGVATTLDRGYLAPSAETPNAIIVDLKGELMEFKLKPWSERVPNIESMRLYRTSVEVRNQLAARVTLHQLELLSGETIESLRVASADGRTRQFQLWQDTQSWGNFLREMEHPSPPPQPPR